MRKFVWRVILFSIASICLLLLMDWIVSNQLKRSSNRIYSSWYDLMQGNITSDVVILGSSRAWVQFSPTILDSILHCDSYNLGIDGSCLNRQITKYELYRQKNKKPERILLNVDFFSFGFTRGYESYQYYPYFYDRDVRERIFPQESFSWAEKWIPFYRYTHLGLNNIPYDDRLLNRGFHAVESSWDGTKLEEMSPIDISFDARTLSLFTSFLNRAQEENIPVVLVYAPVYYKAKDFIRNHDQLEHRLEEFQKEYSFTFLRYDDSPICRDTIYFYNATHLNKKGAELFTEQLASDLLRLGWGS